MLPKVPCQHPGGTVGHPDPPRSAAPDRAEQAVPVRVVGEREPAIDRLPASTTPDLHPAGDEAQPQSAGSVEAPDPGRAGGRGWTDDRPAALQVLRGGPIRSQRVRQRDPRLPVDLGRSGQRTVDPDGADRGIQSGEDALSLPEGVGEEDGGASLRGVRSPPCVHRLEDPFGGVPAVDRQAERAFGEEGVALDRLEGLAGGIRFALVVPGDAPGFVPVPDQHLGRAQDVPRGVQAHRTPPEVPRLPPFEDLALEVLVEPRPHHLQGVAAGEVPSAPRGRVVRMGVGDHRPCDRSPRVDVELPGLAPEAVAGGFKQQGGGHARW